MTKIKRGNILNSAPSGESSGGSFGRVFFGLNSFRDIISFRLRARRAMADADEAIEDMSDETEDKDEVGAFDTATF